MTDTSMVESDSSDNNVTGEDSLPSWDDAVSQPPANQNSVPNKQQNLPSWDDALKQSEPSALGTTAKAIGSMAADSLSFGHYDSSPAVDEFMQHTSVGRILSDFGHGFQTGTSNYQSLGIEPGGEVEKSLQKAGLMNDYVNGENSFRKALTGGIMTSAATALDAFIRTDIGLGISGPAGAIGSAMNETGLTGAKFGPEAMKVETENTTEAILNSPFLAEFHIPKPSFTRKDYKEAQSVGVMDGEDVYMGLKEPTSEQATAQRAAAVDAAPPEREEAQPQPDIHEIARNIAPNTFEEYDRLSTSKDGLQNSLNYLNDQRQLNAETNAPHTAEIEELENKLNDANPRKTKIYQAKIDELTDANRTAIEEAKAKDTPEMAQIRQRLQELDYKMRDLAPDVSAAYRSAKEQLPEVKPAEEKTTSGDIQGAERHEAKATEFEKQASEENASELNKPADEQHAAIVSDITKQLTDLGRPLEEAQASGEIVGRFFRTMSEMYGGAKGTAEEWYAKEGPNIKAGKERTKVLAQAVGKGRELNQAARGKIRLAADDAKATITLFKTANASTFMHESAHNFLDIMTRYAKEEDAPQRLKDDVATINKYLGIGEVGIIKTSQHEKFARSFERYLMEGIAPSKELAGIFQKFHKWLTDIYKTVEQLRAPINNDIRDVFNRLLTNKVEEPIIASERQAENGPIGNGLFEGTKLESFANRLSKIFSGIHKIDAERTPPERAAETADKIEAEIDEVSRNHDKETYDVISKPEVTEVPAEAGGSEQTGQPTEPPSGIEGGSSGPAAVPTGGSDATAEGAGSREPESENTGTASTGSVSGSSNATGEEADPGARGSGSTEENPNQKFGRGESNLVDKAGNIRLDNLSTPEDVNQVIRETAQDNDNFMQARRGVIPVGDQLNLADALGMQPHDLDFRKIGQAFNAEQIIAARKLLIKSAMEVRDAMGKAADGTDADVLAYAEAKTRHQMIQEQVAGITAEAGRALGAFRKLAGDTEAKQIGDFLETSDGKKVETKDLFQRLRQEAELGSKLDTPQQLSKFINDSKKASIRDMVLEYYINALISGPITHLRYSVGNALNALWTPLVEIPVAATIGAIRGTSDRVYFGEAGAQLLGLLKGSRDGLSAAITAFKTGNFPLLPGERASTNFADTIKTNAIPGIIGKAINIPSKSVSAIHSFFKSIRYEQNIQALAYRTAMKEGIAEGTDAFTNRVTELSVNPTEDMMGEATAHSLRELYMSPTEYNSTMGALNRAINSNLLAKIIVPFMKIGGQITRNAFVERTPLGLLDKDVRGNLFSGSAAGDYQAAKVATGVALMGTMSLMTAEGMCTGDGPTDPSKRAIWLLNHTPNSCQVGGITIRYQGLGHLGMLARFSANMTETAQGWDASDGDKLAHSFFSLIEGGTKSVLDENFMRGVKDMLDAVYHPEEYGAQYVRSFATNWLPFSVGSSQTARQIDPYQRQISKNEGFIQQLFDTARSKIPFVSESLQPRRDRFGEPIPNGGPLQSYANDPVVQRMEQLQIGVGRLSQKIRGIPLNGQQFDDYSRLAGRMSKMQLNQIVANPGFNNLPKGIQIETIRKIIESSRSTAASIIMMQSVGSGNDIIKKAKDAKIEAVTSGKKPTSSGDSK